MQKAMMPSFEANVSPEEWDRMEERLAQDVPRQQPSRESLLAEKVRLTCRLLAREYEGLSLYQSLPLGETFHACNAPKRLADGSNRSGKTMTVAAESGRAFSGGYDPYNKYKKYGGNALLVGLDLDHNAMFWRKLTREGAFKIIPDEHTGLYRAVRPDPANPKQLDPYDLAHREKWRDAPPLVDVPRNCIAWDDAKKGIPRLVTFPKSGWKLLCRSSEGKPPQGDAYDLVIFDEEMMNLEFYYEGIRGLLDDGSSPGQHPKLIWSATSQVANPELASLRDQAEQDNPDVRLFNFQLCDNPYFTEESKVGFANALPEEQRLTRVEGIPAIQVRRVYAQYNPQGDAENGTGHGCEPFEIDPKAFCRWIFLDPGLVRAAVLFVAVDSEERFLTVYDGFEAQGARQCAQGIKERENGHKFEAVVCDAIKGKERQSHITQVTCASEYLKAMKDLNIQLRQYGPLNGFFASCSDIEARTQSLRRMMEVRGVGPFEGSCKLRVVRGVIPQLDKEIRRAGTDPKNPAKRYKHAKIPCDLLDDLEYAAAFDPGYRQPEKTEPDDDSSPAFRAFRKKQATARKKQSARRRQYV